MQNSDRKYSEIFIIDSKDSSLGEALLKEKTGKIGKNSKNGWRVKKKHMVIKYCSNFYYICSNLLMLLFNLMKFAAIVFLPFFHDFAAIMKIAALPVIAFVLEHLTFF